MAKRGEMDLIFPGNATSPTPFGLNSAGLWEDVEVCGDRETAARALGSKCDTHQHS